MVALGGGAVFNEQGNPVSVANLYTFRTCPVHFFGRAGTNLGRIAGRDLLTEADGAGGGTGVPRS